MGRRALLRLAVSLMLVGAAACGPTDWPMLGFGPSHAGLSPDTTVNASNVATLTIKWRANPPTPWAPKQYPNLFSSAAVVGGTLYVGSNDGYLYAYDAAGSTNCSGSPKMCAPMWRASLGGPGTYATTAPAVVNGVVYVGAGNTLVAFDAAGNTGCSGTPKTCAPLWTSGPLGLYSSPVVTGGVVYVASYNNSGSSGTVYAFDAAGNIGCSRTPKTCAPMWTAPLGGNPFGSVAVGGGVAYITADDNLLYAFDSAGNVNCSGTPKTCAPLWTATTGDGSFTTPAVVNGVVYVGSGGFSSSGTLYAFDAGSSGCSGTPKTCSPLWTAPLGGGGKSPAVANGVVYLGTTGDQNLYAFDAAGTTNCSGAPKTCRPLWTDTGVSGVIAPALTNGLVYAASSTGLSVFDATGSTNCAGTPKTCSALRVVNTDGHIPPSTALAIANGMVYFSVGYLGAYDYQMYAVGLP